VLFDDPRNGLLGSRANTSWWSLVPSDPISFGDAQLDMPVSHCDGATIDPDSSEHIELYKRLKQMEPVQLRYNR